MYQDSAPEFAPRPREDANEKELTLGPGLLGALGAGLLVLCCLCFIAGYEFGHGAPLPGLKNTAVESNGPSAAELFSQSKPAATSTAPVQDSQPATVMQSSTPETASSEPALATAAPPPAYTLRTSAETAAQPTSATAMPQAQVVPASTNPLVHPALAVTTAQPSGAWRVQIAAVEHTDDASVLVSALRQRGYAVSVRHDPLDNLLHVQVGPFANENAAEIMREKLLNDGYNAILQH